MDPKQFWWTEDQSVTVTNPTSETYKFKVHSKDYELGAGKSAKMPGYIAWVYVYGMGVKLVEADGKFNRWNEEEFKKTYFEKIVAGVDPVVQDVQIEEKPLVVPLGDDLDEEEGDEPKPGTGVNYEVKPMNAKATSGKSPSRA